MSDGEYEFRLFWNEILEEEKQKGNNERVKEIEDMINNTDFEKAGFYG